VTLVAKGGAVSSLIGIDHEVPVAPFMPVMMFAILFGLSMDYEVFLISRIREEYLKHGDTSRAVADGLAKTARVITAAAAIMVVVFLAFLAAPDVFLKLFGIGLASAIFLDATIVRMVLIQRRGRALRCEEGPGTTRPSAMSRDGPARCPARPRSTLAGGRSSQSDHLAPPALHHSRTSTIRTMSRRGRSPTRGRSRRASGRRPAPPGTRGTRRP